MLVLYLTYIDDENDKKRFEKLYYAYRKQMAILALSIVKNETDAEDVVHDVFMNIAIRHMNTVNGIEDEEDRRNYLLKATKNTALNWMKKKKRIVFQKKEESLENSTVDIKQSNFVEYLCQIAEYKRVVEAIKCLEPKYRDVLYYHFVMEIPVSQVAKSLNQSLSATKKQLVRGKKKLLHILEGDRQDGNI